MRKPITTKNNYGIYGIAEAEGCKKDDLTLESLNTAISLLNKEESPIDEWFRSCGFDPKTDCVIFPISMKEKLEVLFPYGIPKNIAFSLIIEDGNYLFCKMPSIPKSFNFNDFYA